jgi:hypothetical protein
MKKLIYSCCILVFALSCNNEAKESKTTEITTDTIITVQPDSTLNLDSLLTNSAPVSSTGEAIDLKFNMKKGSSYEYSIVTETDMGAELQGQSMKSGIGFSYVLKVLDEKNSLKTLKATYGPMYMNMDMGGQKMAFTSEDAPADKTNPLTMITRMFGAMKGKSFEITMNEKGKVSKVSGFDKLSEAVIDEMDVPAEQRQNFMQTFTSQFNESSAMEMFSQSFNIFPPGPVKVGDSWEHKGKLASPGAGTDMRSVYTLKEIKGKIAIIDAVSQYQLQGDRNIKSFSRMEVDRETGLVLRSDGEQKIEGTNKVLSRNKVTSRIL